MKTQNKNKELNNDKHKNICRFLTFVLRHKPQIAHLKLDEEGFSEIAPVTVAIEKRFKIKPTEEDLKKITNKYASGFFIIKNNKIKAKFGHSIILSMVVPEFFKPCSLIPNYLYGCIHNNAMWSVSKKGLQSSAIVLGLYDDKSKLKKPDKHIFVVIDCKKINKNNIQFYKNEKLNKYFCKFIPETYVKFELN